MNYNEMAREYKITANELLKKIENLKIEKKGSYGIQLNELNHRIRDRRTKKGSWWRYR